jgi:signal transduction histidine kinase
VYSARTHTERFIATGRVLLAAVVLLALWLNPSTPVGQTATAYTLLIIYSVYAAALLVPLVWSQGTSLRRSGLVTHAIDLPVLTLLMYYTEGSTSPFFLIFIFLLLGAMVRWQWRGTLWTAIGVLLLYFGLGIYEIAISTMPRLDFDLLLIRCGQFIVLAVLLGFMSLHEQRRREELNLLADWPWDVPPDSLIRESLRTVAAIFKAPRVLMIWEEPDEPWCYVATFFGDDFQLIRESPMEFEPLVVEPLTEFHFLRPNPHGISLITFKTGFMLGNYRHGSPLNTELESRFTIGKALSLVLRSTQLSGRLFILDKPNMSIDDLIFGNMVARQVVAHMEQWYLQRYLQQTAVTEERLHLARELHDGLLQSLTGINLQVAILPRLMETAPEAACARVADIQALLTAEQRELRLFVQKLKPIPPGTPEDESPLINRLEELQEKIARQWGLAVELHAEKLPQSRISSVLIHEAYRLVQEALINAARHGDASTVRVDIETKNHELQITVADNGSGFPFRGRYDLATLNTLQQGPVSLKGRIASLQGDLIIDSTESGSRLQITLPLTRHSRNWV